MRNWLRETGLNSFALIIVSRLFASLAVPENLGRLILAGLTVALLNRLVKPIIKLFLLPINLLTFGLFNWLGNVVVLFFAGKIIPELVILPFSIASFSSASGFAFPGFSFTYFPALILTSLTLSLVYNLLDKILCG